MIQTSPPQRLRRLLLSQNLRFQTGSRRFLALFLSGITLLGIVGCKKTSPPPSHRAKRPAPTMRPIRVTGIPDENPTELQRKYAPMVRFLSKALKRPVQYVPVTDYSAAVQALVAGKIDFAWLGGFTHVQARTLTQVEPLVMREIDRHFRSVFLVHTKSTARTVRDLKGKTFAFGSKSSTSGHLMPRHYLQTTFQINPDKDFQGRPVYSGAHDATAKIVESGKVEAGVLNREVWLRLLRNKQIDPKRVRSLWTTPDYVDYVWTARKAVSKKLRDAFAQAFLELNPKQTDAQAILKLQGAKKFVKAFPKNFDAIEKVALSTGLLKPQK